MYPPPDQMFTALNLCSYESVKVVIIGQDPYHGPNQVRNKPRNFSFNVLLVCLTGPYTCNLHLYVLIAGARHGVLGATRPGTAAQLEEHDQGGHGN